MNKTFQNQFSETKHKDNVKVTNISEINENNEFNIIKYKPKTNNNNKNNSISNSNRNSFNKGFQKINLNNSIRARIYTANFTNYENKLNNSQRLTENNHMNNMNIKLVNKIHDNKSYLLLKETNGNEYRNTCDNIIERECNNLITLFLLFFLFILSLLSLLSLCSC